MSKIERKEPGERDENSESGQEIPEALRPNKQRLIQTLEAERASLNNAIKTGRKEVAAAVQKNVDQLENQINGITYEETKTERKRLISENFGQETLNGAESVTASIGSSIEEHLLTAKDKKEAGKILALWKDLSNIMSGQAHDRPKALEEALKEAYSSITHVEHE